YAGTNAGLFRSNDQGRTWRYVKKEAEVPEEEKKTLSNQPYAPAIPGLPEEADSLQPVKSIAPTTPTTPSTRPRRVTGRLVKPILRRPTAPQRKQVKVKAQVKTQKKKPIESASKQKQQPKTPPRNPNDPIDLQNQVFSIIPFTLRTEDNPQQPPA